MASTDPKKTLVLLAMMSWMSSEGCNAPPVTITQRQMKAVFAPGRTMRLLWDSTSQPVNVGGTGGPHIYDFRTLPFVQYDSVSMLSVAQIPQLRHAFRRMLSPPMKKRTPCILCLYSRTTVSIASGGPESSLLQQSGTNISFPHGATAECDPAPPMGPCRF